MAGPTTKQLPDSVLTSVLELAHERYSEDLSVPDLADHAGYSPFHFTRLFTAAMRVSPGQFLTAVRMDAAKRLLLAEEVPVIDVATAVGFDSLSSFSRRFKTTVGVPPAALRRLAHKVADRPPSPFRMVPENRAAVTVSFEVPQSLLPSGDLSVWLGWYAAPAPVGLPAGGVLSEYGETVRLPLSPGAPWLLGFAVARAASVEEHLAPSWPVVAVHPVPITKSGKLSLEFRQADLTGVPLLTALPSLCRGMM